MNNSFNYLVLHLAVFLIAHSLGLYEQGNHLTDKVSAGINSDFDTSDILTSNASLYFIQFLITFTIVLVFFIYSNVKTAQFICKRSSYSPTLIHLSISFSSNIILLLLNTLIFPDSIYILSIASDWHISTGLKLLLWAALLTPITLTLTNSYWHHPKTYTTALCLIMVFWIIQMPSKNKQNQENLIIIGIDSLRPELIQEYMPNLTIELENSVVFENATTPFARTYPAWMSILTGRHPSQNGARFNLQPESMLNKENEYFPEHFKEMGYQTIYASDERRFSNLGDVQGFEKVIGPRTGVSDFVLGNYLDFPLINVFTQLPVSEAILPEIISNRAAKLTYHPAQFSSTLDKAINQLDERRPLLLAVHFCLPHWPYTFVGHRNINQYQPKPAYPDNLAKVDKQIQQLLNQLSLNGWLKNSKLIFLSDHGESWGKVSSGLTNRKGETLEVMDYGHGMNILSPDSHNVLLALKGFQLDKKGKRLSSLIDIAPTVNKAFSLNMSHALFDGQSLLSKPIKPIEQSFESGLVIDEANTEQPDPEKIAKAGAHRFQIQSNGTLRLKQALIPNMLQSKQLGLRIDNQGLFKGRFKDYSTEYIHINYQTNTYDTYQSLKTLPPQATEIIQRFCELYNSTQTKIAADCAQM